MANCAKCKNLGRKVERVTLDHLLRDERRPEIGDGPYYVCPTPGCGTVYFAETGRLFDESSLSVRIGLKESHRPRTICYCFDHTIEAIHDEIGRTGRSTAVDRIKAEMSAAGCRCEKTNPLGACCLETVRATVAEGFRLVGSERSSEVAGRGGVGGRCAPRASR